MKLAIGCIFYNPGPEIKKLIETTPRAIQIYAFDGKFAGFKDGNPECISNDGTFEYLDRQPNVKASIAADLEQWEKRNMYLEQAADDGVDYLIVGDSDHYFLGDWPQFVENIQDFLYEHRPPSALRIPLLTRGNDDVWRFVHVAWVLRPSIVEYFETHDKIIDEDGNQILAKDCPIVNGLLMVNDHSIRSQTRTDDGIHYKLLNRIKEGKTT